MECLIDENRPIFVQIAERIEEDILAGRLAEEEQVIEMIQKEVKVP